MAKRAIFIAATGQHVGKTTTCLGIFSGLIKRFSSVGFLKPVGQETRFVENGDQVDKDALLFKKHFSIKDSFKEMNPVLCPQGFTRKYLDNKAIHQSLLDSILKAKNSLTEKHDTLLVEGTGHVGVGSIFDLNNAVVAKALDLEVVLVTTGGLGSSFDTLCLNIQMLKAHNVPIKGVILNKVLDKKRDMIMQYYPKALQPYGIPLLGCIPYTPFLQRPSMADFELLFSTKLLCGQIHRYRHFADIRLVAGSLESFLEEFCPNQLIITPACREDIIIGAISSSIRLSDPVAFTGGLILTGKNPPRKELLDRITGLDIPILYAPLCSFDVMKMITSHTAKIQEMDTEKIEKAIDAVEHEIDFSKL